MVLNELTGGLLGLLAVQVLHLIEEVQTGFRVQFPLGEMPRPVFLGINALLYTYFLATILLAALYHPLAAPLAWPLAMVMVLNGLAHLGMMVLRRAYFPGGWSAPLLVLTAGAVLLHLFRR